ncbi:hypothetical protein H7F36_16695 [Variovorax sp. PAMC28562]|uniref:hypothetical protein n=1 Tax=Variovorax sp. PAMC28562 TaxID=2762323 RepID=UPI00164D31F1|nr:hypothetical protein [Variovorax sp. PAMC28562]QNK72807.1 hypothetical protein H7F36_16695 [Variovorax sp. PAMC28562]
MKINTFVSQFDGSTLVGREVMGYSPDRYGASLLLERGEGLSLSAEEHSAGRWFEVFTLQAEADSCERAWILFPEPLLVDSSVSLWRNEWLEEGAALPTLGANPKTQHAGRGPVPEGATAAAQVQAGLILHGSNGHVIFAAASATSPFAVDVSVDQQEIPKLLDDFEMIEIGTPPPVG